MMNSPYLEESFSSKSCLIQLFCSADKSHKSTSSNLVNAILGPQGNKCELFASNCHLIFNRSVGSNGKFLALHITVLQLVIAAH